MPDSNEVEARGLSLVKDLVKASTSGLLLKKTAEGARADFCVLVDRSKAVGIQLKTTQSVQVVGPGRWEYAQFRKATGYDGLMVLFVAFFNPVRMWLLPGNLVPGDHPYIPLLKSVPSHIKRWNWEQYEVSTETLAQALHSSLVAPRLSVRPVEEIMMPECPTRRAEYQAFLRLCSQLPLDFVEPDIEHRPFDYFVQGSKWQLKSASYIGKVDVFQSALEKHSGRVNGKLTMGQYAADDFDWLAVTVRMDTDCPTAFAPVMYLIPSAVLVARGIMGGAGKPTTIRFYPHRHPHKPRSANGTRAPKRVKPSPEPHWTDHYRVDLTNHTTAMADYTRLVAEARS